MINTNYSSTLAATYAQNEAAISKLKALKESARKFTPLMTLHLTWDEYRKLHPLFLELRENGYPHIHLDHQHDAVHLGYDYVAILDALASKKVDVMPFIIDDKEGFIFEDNRPLSANKSVETRASKNGTRWTFHLREIRQYIRSTAESNREQSIDERHLRWKRGANDFAVRQIVTCDRDFPEMMQHSINFFSQSREELHKKAAKVVKTVSTVVIELEVVDPVPHILHRFSLGLARQRVEMGKSIESIFKAHEARINHLLSRLNVPPIPEASPFPTSEEEAILATPAPEPTKVKIPLPILKTAYSGSAEERLACYFKEQPPSMMDFFRKQAETGLKLWNREKLLQNVVYTLSLNRTFDLEVSAQKDILDALTTFSSGFCVGENHHQADGKKFLIENMAALVSRNVTTIFMEGFCDVLHQKMLDAYFKQEGDEMPEEMQRGALSRDRQEGLEGSPYSESNLVKTCKKFGVRIRAFESMLSYSIGSLTRMSLTSNHLGIHPSKARCYTMNEDAARAIALFQKENPDSKYVFFGGLGHATTYLGVTGLAEMLDCPAVIATQISYALEPHRVFQKRGEPNSPHIYIPLATPIS